MESLQFHACIPEIGSAIKASGKADEAGRVTLELPGTDVAALAKLLLYRGKLLKVTVEVDS